MTPQNQQPNQAPAVKMIPVDADTFESIGYVVNGRLLYVKFRNTPPLVFNNVPGFRYDGLMAAPRKDAYFQTFIKNFFLSKPAQLP
jgi:KTSC domain